MIIDYLMTGLAGYDPDEFPQVQGFEVRLEPGAHGFELTFTTTQPDHVVEWAWITERDHEIWAWTIGDVPCGTNAKPYRVSDQGWNILVWEQNGHVFVAQGEGEWDYERDADTFTTWFKVTSDLYRAAWTTALEELTAR
ncbi:hypothetical protein [Actinoplanes friuliensis]|uniref:Uncharacterized protein n=1 Tax=Actinoplanes friuliensis DSM 7358 TaxID=1246995 RepID=U5VTN2_9ACTN|nr:hypothetical protein [Actinoplanes friuliensis]AGZ39050.1 hypothetical protein AFR_03805 [Actinoplanes friuliensis DSM 7358]